MIIETINVVKHLWWLKKPHTNQYPLDQYVLININFLNDGCVLNQPHVFIDELLMRSSLALSLLSLSLLFFWSKSIRHMWPNRKREVVGLGYCVKSLTWKEYCTCTGRITF